MPRLVLAIVRRIRAVASRVRARRRLRAIASVPVVAGPTPCVYYGIDALAGEGEVLSGGAVKFQRLARDYPNVTRGFNVLYLGSSSAPSDASRLIAVAKRRGARLVWNQDGVAYPGLEGWDVERTNGPMAESLAHADFVVYQSEFCKLSADRFLGPPAHDWEIVYNAVDTTSFTPGAPPTGLVLLLGGSQYQWYRLEVALRTLAAVRRRRPDAVLHVTGRLTWARDERSARATADGLAAELGISEHVRYLGPFSQRQAPGILRNAHLMLHTKYNDPCPGAVIEAMACGLPIVYSASGGVPELVGDAGVGVPAPVDFERDHPPDPEALADAVLAVAERREELGARARQRAEEHFDLRPWVERHRAIFERLVA